MRARAPTPNRAYQSYVEALSALKSSGGGDWTARDGISVKLSAIHPRFETAQVERSDRELYPRLVELGQLARGADVNLTIDAEESERLALHIGLFERLMREPSLADWPGLGLAIQTYQTRAPATIDHLLALSAELSRPITVRFTKGAYWDAEIKRAQELGLADFRSTRASGRLTCRTWRPRAACSHTGRPSIRSSPRTMR